VRAERRDWFETAKRLLHALKPSSALLFIDRTDQIAHWEARLRYEGFAAGALYGDADKLTRAQTLERLRDGRLRVVVTTDVAARGIDIPELELVVSLGAPADAERYIHRAGRTGRMGREGTVVVIADDREWFRIGKLARKLGIAIEERELYSGELAAPGARRRGSARASAGADKTAGRRRVPDTDKPVKAAAPRPKAAKSDARPASPKPARPEPRAEAVRTPAGGKSKRREREIDRKNKGAPRWLKAKWESAGQPAKE
jgi:superfamily II DNA/RNA helicase